MGKILYDFREGLDQEKIVYRNTDCDCKSVVYYLLYLMFAWSWVVVWFALFHYAYIYHEPIAFWVYIGVWLTFIIGLSSIIIYNLVNHSIKKKARKKLEAMTALEKRDMEKKDKEAKEKKQKERDNEAYRLTTVHNENALLNP